MENTLFFTLTNEALMVLDDKTIADMVRLAAFSGEKVGIVSIGFDSSSVHNKTIQEEIHERKS